MSFFYTGDPHRDFDLHEAEKERWLKSRPKCSICKEHIQEEHCYEIDGKRICPECLEENFKVDIDD